MMAKSKRDRYDMGADIVADLDAITSGEKNVEAIKNKRPQVPSPSADNRNEKQATLETNNKITYGVIGFVTVLLVATWWAWSGPNAGKTLTHTSTMTANDELPLAPEPSTPLSKIAGQDAISAPPALVTPATADNPSNNTTTTIPRTIDLLTLINPTRDAVYGTWTRRGDALLIDNAGSWDDGHGAARLAIRY